MITSRFDYEASKEIRKSDPPFYAIIMAAMMKADSHNAAKLRLVFPPVWDELQERYDAPGGYIRGEVPVQ